METTAQHSLCTGPNRCTVPRQSRARWPPNAGDEIILDNQGVVKATPIKRKGVVKDQDYRDIGYHNASLKDSQYDRLRDTVP